MKVMQGALALALGFMVLAVTSAGGLDLVRGTAAKVFLALIQTAVSVSVFAWAGTIVWSAALALAFGCVLGSLAGVVLSMGSAWLLMKFVFEATYNPSIAPVLLVAAAMTALAIVIGLATGREVFRETPMAALREA